MNKLKLLFIGIVLFCPLSILSQSSDDKMIELKSNKQLYTVFNKFYTDSIRQEKKDEWGGPYYYEIDVVYSLYYLDYNNDGLKDVLVEFSCAASDGGTWYFFTAVLFENKKGKYNYICHVNPNYTVFDKYDNDVFYFKGVRFKTLLDENRSKEYKLVDNKFVE